MQPGDDKSPEDAAVVEGCKLRGGAEETNQWES